MGLLKMDGFIADLSDGARLTILPLDEVRGVAGVSITHEMRDGPKQGMEITLEEADRLRGGLLFFPRES